MNITLNSLPAKTWNRLNMNKSTAELEGEFLPHAPQAVYDENTVTWTPGSGWSDPRSACGLSPDFTALAEKAAPDLVETAAGRVMDKPIVLTYRYAQGEHAVSRLVFHAAPDSLLSAVILMDSPLTGGGDSDLLQIQVLAEENARLDLFVAQLTGRDSLCLNEIGGTCAKGAQVKLTRLELGGRSAWSGANLDLAGADSSFTAEIGYHARPGQLLDMNYVALHRGRNTNSLMEANGTLEDGSKKVFRGTIDFRQGCAGAKGTENENVLLLGDDMVNQTIPLILCKEEDVEGNHGASIGQLDERLLFYLGSRGIAAEDAQQMIARSRIEAICEKFPVEEIREQIRNYEYREVQ